MIKNQEFDYIQNLFRPFSCEKSSLQLKDDAALIEQGEEEYLCVTQDVLVENIHFFPHENPDRLAQKALAINVSDLAAMGAEPLGFFSSLVLSPLCDKKWLENFSQGLKFASQKYHMPVMGGDISRSLEEISIHITALGRVKKGCEFRRSWAQNGDTIAVSGEIGNGALGLMVKRGLLTDDAHQSLLKAYDCPIPRLDVAHKLMGHRIAAMDISDGLMGDLHTLCQASKVGAHVDMTSIPLSNHVRELLKQDEGLWSKILTGGDDYQLLICGCMETLKPLCDEKLITAIGSIVPENKGVCFRDHHQRPFTPLNGKIRYNHFDSFETS